MTNAERHPEPTYICRCAQLFGWEITAEPSAEGGTLTVKPCSRCRPDTFQRWAEGRFDHRSNRGATR